MARCQLGIVGNSDVMSSSKGWSIAIVCVYGIITILINIRFERTEIVFVTKGEDEAVRT